MYSLKIETQSIQHHIADKTDKKKTNMIAKQVIILVWNAE